MSKRNALTAELKVGDKVMVITDGESRTLHKHYVLPGAVGKVVAFQFSDSLPIGVDFGRRSKFVPSVRGHTLNGKIKRFTGQWLARTDLILMPKKKVKRAR